jgi:hypothetical protein
VRRIGALVAAALVTVGCGSSYPEHVGGDAVIGKSTF